MTLLAQTACYQSNPGDGIEFSTPYRQFETSDRDGKRRPDVTVTLSHAPELQSVTTELQTVVAFLIDTTYGAVGAATLGRMIGHYFFALGSGTDAITVSIGNSTSDRATTRVKRPKIEVEHTAFGAAHIPLHEDGTLGLYILEVAPHSTIPAHCHRVMRESELILDDGLLQQGRPVARGAAFSWPLGYVHAYRNPTGQPRRILCVDSPRFIPEDEVPLMAPLVPLAPSVNYLA